MAAVRAGRFVGIIMALVAVALAIGIAGGIVGSIAGGFAGGGLLGGPERAFAASGGYSIDELSTEINVETNGAAHVIERQVYTFNSECEGCVWYLHVPESGESVRISSVRVAPVDDGGALIGDWTTLQAVDVKRVPQGTEPGDVAVASLRLPDVRPWYSYSIGDGMMRCYFPTEPDKLVGPRLGRSTAVSTQTSDTNSYLIETDYTVAHRVRVHSDVGELYWRYANSSLPTDAHNVSLHITLPVPADSGEGDTANGTIVPGETVVAWGHGPDAGTFEIAADGSITYFVDSVERGNYAEAHILFPASWMTNLAPNSANVFTGMRRAAAMAEESAWVDSSMRGENWDNAVRALFLAIALVIILVGTVSVVRNGRSPRSRRALIRVAVTLVIVMLGAQLFFREPLTIAMLAGIAIVVGAVALWLPIEDDEDDEGEVEST